MLGGGKVMLKISVSEHVFQEAVTQGIKNML